MIRHMSLFRMSPNPENGSTMEENIAALQAYLEKLPEQVPAVTRCRITVNVQTEEQDGVETEFTQVCQLLDFVKIESVDEYLESPVYRTLRDYAARMTEKVIDINLHI